MPDDGRNQRLVIHGGASALELERLDAEHAALVLIDMQYLDAHPAFGQGKQAKELGVFAGYQYYFDELASVVVPRLTDLLNAARQYHLPVIHTRVASQTRDGRERSLSHKMLNVIATEGTKDSEFLEELAPIDGEIVLSKGCSGAFNGTAIDQILRNMEIDTIIVGGVVTNFCVETTVRDASDRGYNVILASDGCAAYTDAEQKFALSVIDGSYAMVALSSTIVRMIEGATAGVSVG